MFVIVHSQPTEIMELHNAQVIVSDNRSLNLAIGKKTPIEL